MGQESAAVKAEWRQHDWCHQHMGCVFSMLHSWYYQLEEDELEAVDRNTRKMMTVYYSLYPRADVDRLYIPRKHIRRGLMNIQECIYGGAVSKQIHRC